MAQNCLTLLSEAEWKSARQQAVIAGALPDPMFELKDEFKWRPGMTFEKFRDELKEKLDTFPGMPAIWWVAIQTRTEMMSSGKWHADLPGRQEAAQSTEGPPPATGSTWLTQST